MSPLCQRTRHARLSTPLCKPLPLPTHPAYLRQRARGAEPGAQTIHTAVVSARGVEGVEVNAQLKQKHETPHLDDECNRIEEKRGVARPVIGIYHNCKGYLGESASTISLAICRAPFARRPNVTALDFGVGRFRTSPKTFVLFNQRMRDRNVSVRLSESASDLKRQTNTRSKVRIHTQDGEHNIKTRTPLVTTIAAKMTMSFTNIFWHKLAGRGPFWWQPPLFVCAQLFWGAVLRYGMGQVHPLYFCFALFCPVLLCVVLL